MLTLKMDVRRNVGSLLTPRVPRRKQKPQSYSRQTVNSSCSLHEPGSEFSPEPAGGGLKLGHSLAFSLVVARIETPVMLCQTVDL